MKKFLLSVTLILLHFFNSEAQTTAIDGDFRTVSSGNWNSTATWQVRTAGSWGTTSLLPTASTNVFIQSAHSVTLDATGAVDGLCKNLNLNNAGFLQITNAAYSVKVSGKIRSWTGAVVTSASDFADASSTTLAATMITTSTTTGILKFVGASRPITVAAEWANSNVPCNVEFALDNGAVGTLGTNIKFGTILFSSGTLNAQTNQINVGSSITALTIKNGAKVISARSLGDVFANSSTARCGTVTIDAGGILELTGATPYLDCTSFVCNGTVAYTGNVNQNFLQPFLAAPNTGVAITQYGSIILSGSGTNITKTAVASISISGSLQVDAGVTFDMNVAGYDITGALTSVNNNGTIKTYSSSTAPIPSGKDWQGLGATGTVNYALPSASVTGQTVVIGTYKNLSISNTNAFAGRTTFQAGVINISGNFTVAAPSTTTTNVVTGNTINFTNPNGGQTIAATNYNNLNITTNASVNQSLANGTFYILGTFNPGSYPFVFYQTLGANPNGFNFYNPTGGQNIPKFNYVNLTVSNSSGNTTVVADTIGVSGVFTKGVGTYSPTPVGNTFNFNSSTGGQTIPVFDYYNLIISDATAVSSNNTIASDINVTNSVRLAGKFGLQPTVFKIIYGANATLFCSAGSATLTTFKTSPFWPETSGPTNVTVNSGTLQFEAPTAANNFVVSNVQLTNNIATITTSGTHNFVAGNSVTLGGLNTSEFGFVFGGTFTVAANPPVTANTFSFALTYADVPSTVVIGGVALANITRTISGILRLDGGRLKVNAGNFLRMGGGSTIIRNTDVSKLNLTNGFLALGSTSTDRVNITIGATMFDDNEFASFTTPGGYGTLTLNPGIRYNLSGSRAIVDLNALGASQLSLKDTSNFYIYGDILATSSGTISGKPNATLHFLGSNPNALSTSLKFTTDSISLGTLKISRSGLNAQIQLGTSLNITNNLLLSAGPFNIGSLDI